MDRDDLIDLIEAALDNVHDMDVTLRDYAEAAADAVIAARRGEHTIYGRGICVGLARAVFGNEEGDDLDPDTPIFVMSVEADTAGGVPIALLWADRIKVVLEEVPSAIAKATGETA